MSEGVVESSGHHHPHHHGPHARHPHRPTQRGLLLALAGLTAVAAALFELAQLRAPRLLAVAVEAGDAARVCQKPACELGEFWDRAAAVGVSAVVLRERPLKELALRGEVLHVSREEFEKWKALGLVAPGATLKPETIWIKDPRVVAQVLDAVQRQGVSVSTAASAGYTLVQFPDGYAAASESLGAYDAEILASLSGHRLAEVFSESRDETLPEVGLRWQGAGRLAGYAGQRGEWSVKPARIEASAGKPGLLRAAFGDPSRLLILRLSAASGSDEAIAQLRKDQRALAEAGLFPGLPDRAPSWPDAEAYRWALLFALWGLGLVGPLLAARAGLTALKVSRALAKERWPVLCPVAELVVGMLAAAAAAAAVGILARACLEWLGLPWPGAEWARACMVAPIIVGLLTLYTIDLEEWAKVLAAPLSRGQALIALGLAIAGALILDPSALLLRAGLWPALQRLESFSGPLWWLPWRWRETLIGVPCLLQAMLLIDWRLGCPDCASAPSGALGDARTWFLPGLMAPAGVASAIARRGLPLGVALGQTVSALALGTVLGCALIALRLRSAHRPKGLEHDRSLVLDG